MIDPVAISHTLLLSRIQFAANISFHILFPAITVALCWMLLYFKLRYHFSSDRAWLSAYRFWVKVFALSFALGVVSGITMSFQFGTNWPGFMEQAGNIAGPLLGYEVLTAFFLEATFLGIMLFGMERVSQRTHSLATLLVAIGTSLSAFWIMALNAWMQTPSGYELRDQVFYPSDWWQIVFNPSLPYRLTHMFIASGLTAAFLVAGISAYRLLKGDNSKAPRLALVTAIQLAALLAPLQIVIGDLHGLNTLEHQPAKVAAIEGLWHTREAAPLVLFAIPDAQLQENRFSVEVPGLASLILTHEWQGEVKGISAFGNQHPPVAPVFWSFRVMVGVGLLMLASAWLALSYPLRKKDLPPFMLRWLVSMTFAGWLATLAGWYVSEIGRQPFLVHGLLLTEQAVTTQPQANVAISLILYLSLYVVLLGAFVHALFNMARKASASDDEAPRTLQDSNNPFNQANETHQVQEQP